MTADDYGMIALVTYAIILCAILRWRLRKYSPSRREAWFTLAIRLYSPLMFGQRFRERCPWPAEGAALIVANHSSPTDPIMIHAASLAKDDGLQMRIVEWLTAREYCEQPGMVGKLCDIARCIPVSRAGRDMAAVREAIRRAKEGRLIGIFPEGGLNDGVNLREFHTGVAFLATAADLPVFPVYIQDSPKAHSMLAAFLTKSTTHVHFGEEVNLAFVRSKKRPSQQDLELATQTIRDALLALDPNQPIPEDAVAGRIGRSA